MSDDCNLFGSDDSESEASEPEITQNKRGRKAKTINFDSGKSINSTFNLEETVILTLPISLESISRLNSIYTNKYTKSSDGDMKKIKPYNYYPLKKDNKNGKVLEKIEEITKTFSELTIDGYNSVVVIKDYIPFKIERETSVTDIRKLLSSKTNLRCWWDCHTFDSYPLSFPVSFNRNNQLFKCEGVYCSWNCVISHGKELRKDTSLVYLLKSVLDKENDKGSKSFVKIKDAPSKYIIDTFGGPITIEEYRKSFSNLTCYNLNVYPMIYIPTEFVEKTISKEKENSISLTDSNVEKSINRIKENKYVKEEKIYSDRSQKYLSKQLEKLNTRNDGKPQESKSKPNKNNSLLKMIGAVVVDT